MSIYEEMQVHDSRLFSTPSCSFEMGKAVLREMKGVDLVITELTPSSRELLPPADTTLLCNAI